MASSKRCSICQKRAGICFCPGCNSYFCDDDFKDHRGMLVNELDELTIGRNELQEKINKMTSHNNSGSTVLSEIDEWQRTTTGKVNQVAEQARQQVLTIMSGKREEITAQFRAMSQELKQLRDTKDVIEQDLARLRQQIDHLNEDLKQLSQPPAIKLNVTQSEQINWHCMIYVEEKPTYGANQQSQSRSKMPLHASWMNMPPNAKWNKNGQTVGGQNLTLSNPWGLFVDDDQTVYIADRGNHRIVTWKEGETNGQVVAGGHGQGEGTHQLNYPTDVILDKETDSLIISDFGNKRVIRWPRRNGTSGETIISNIACYELTMNKQGSLYVADVDKHEIRRYRRGESQGTVVAGGNGQGDRLNQLNWPTYIFVDRDHSVFVSDWNNHRVIKWIEGAKEGMIVAGGQGQGSSLSQVHYPTGVLVDHFGTVYVADVGNHRIVRWPKRAQQGSVIAGGNSAGAQANQLNGPMSLSFDRHGHLYVVDSYNDRLQRFKIEMPLN